MKKNYLQRFLPLAIILSVFIFFESLLRIFQFTYYPVDTGLTVPSEYTMFQKAGDFYEDSTHIRFKVNKPQNEFRVFILGGSSVANLGGFCQHKNWLKKLQEMLQQQVHHNKINIIGLGYSSWGTNRLLLLFKEIMNYSPDLVIIYAGHNEFEEEYMRHIFKRSPAILNINNQLLRASKIYQLLSLGIRKIIIRVAKAHVDSIQSKKPAFPPETQKKWGIVFDKKQIYTNYSYNLNQMAQIAKNHHVPIIFSTLAYNRRYPPHAPSKEGGFEYCESLLSNSNFNAENQECFENEVSSDTQPHRASREINQIVKKIANFYQIPLMDIDKAIVSKAARHIPGDDLFKDWCHLNEDGNQILIIEFYETILSLKDKINLK